LAEDPPASEVIYLHKYFQIFNYFISQDSKNIGLSCRNTTLEAMPFETIALDFITKLPTSQGYDSILTVTDHNCTKAVVFIPCKESIMAEETVGLIIQHIFL